MLKAQSRIDGPLVWVLKDGRPGTGNQAVGVADAIKVKYQIKKLELSAFGRLPNLLLGGSLRTITSNAKKCILPPWPDLVISAGRRAASVALHIKRESEGRTFICQIMFPGDGLVAELDLVAVPKHDQIEGRNIWSITGAPNRITDVVLSEARSRWQQEFSQLPRPIVGLIVGGATKRMPLGTKQVEELAQLIADHNRTSGGSIIVTTSRRTGKAADTLFEKLSKLGRETVNFHRWNEGNENPYLGILSYSDILIVTGDSITMLSEACAAPGGVYIYTPTKFSSVKHLRFHAELYAMDAARPLQNELKHWKSVQFNSANDVAKEINLRLGW